MREKRSFVVTLGIAVLALAACGDPMPSSGGDLLWTLQFGTSEADQGAAVAVADDGRIAVAGETRGDLGGPSQGGKDAFVRLLDGDRAVVWTRQFGSPVDDVVQGLAFHPGGGLVVAGLTYGDLGGANTGGYDAFVRRLDTDGQAAWTHQFGSIAHDVIDALAIDADGRVVVAGTTRGVLQGTGFGTGDAFVRQLAAATGGPGSSAAPVRTSRSAWPLDREDGSRWAAARAATWQTPARLRSAITTPSCRCSTPMAMCCGHISSGRTSMTMCSAWPSQPMGGCSPSA
jgi:hypothetical protein